MTNNGRVLHKSRKLLEIILSSLALILMIKVALSPHSLELVFSSSWSHINRLLSSHICICIIINFMVLLILAISQIEPKPVKEELIATNPKEEETIEMINGDVNLDPKSKHLEKRDMPNVVRSTARWKELRKSETFNDCVFMRCRGGLIRRDPLTSLGEFNEQVESFIKRFNDEMKLQRQESDQSFLDMQVKRRI